MKVLKFILGMIPIFVTFQLISTMWPTLIVFFTVLWVCCLPTKVPIIPLGFLLDITLWFIFMFAVYLTLVTILVYTVHGSFLTLPQEALKENPDFLISYIDMLTTLAFPIR